MPVTEGQQQALHLAAVALDETELAQVVKRTLLINRASQAICRVHGPRNGCHCKGDVDRCHAHLTGWQEEARAVVMEFERIGAFK